MATEDFMHLKKGDKIPYFAGDNRLTNWEVVSVHPTQPDGIDFRTWLDMREKFDVLPEGRTAQFYQLISLDEKDDYTGKPISKLAHPYELEYARLHGEKKLKAFRVVGQGVDFDYTKYEETIYAENESAAIEVLEDKIRENHDHVLTDSDGGVWAEELDNDDEESEDEVDETF
jgi:uncharacterized protein YecE (DUF72 family)